YIVIASIFIFDITRITSTYKKSLFESMVIIAISVLLIDIISIAVVFFNRGFAFPRSIFIIGYVIQCIMIFTFKNIILYFIKRNYKQQKALIITPNENSNLLTKDFLLYGINNGKVESICEDVNQNTYRLIDK